MDVSITFNRISFCIKMYQLSLKTTEGEKHSHRDSHSEVFGLAGESQNHPQELAARPEEHSHQDRRSPERYARTHAVGPASQQYL